MTGRAARVLSWAYAGVDFTRWAAVNACPICGAEAYLVAFPEGAMRRRWRCDHACSACDGRGWVWENECCSDDETCDSDCPVCHGTGAVLREDTTLHLERA